MLDSSFSLLLQAHVEQWIDFSTTAVDAPLCSWVYPLLGFMPFDKKVGGALQKQGLVQNLMGLKTPLCSYMRAFPAVLHSKKHAWNPCQLHLMCGCCRQPR